KYFLQASSWPYNTGNKEVTYNLFHHHGGAFQTIYSEVPMDLIVLHDNVLLTGTSSFTVTADSGAFIALSHNGEILGTAESDGTPQFITITALIPGDIMDVVVTKQNYFRYHAPVDVIPANMPYVVYNDFDINDDAGNGDGILDYGESVLLSLTLENVGLIDALGVDAIIASGNTHITITDNTAFFGDILSLQTVTVTDEYAFDVATDVADGELVTFNVEATDGDSIWNSFFSMQAHAPLMEYVDFMIDDAAGNGNGRLDPDETVEITVFIANSGSSEAYNVDVALSCSSGYVTISGGPVVVGDMSGYSTGEATFTVSASANTPGGFNALFSVNINADMDISGSGGFDIIIGQFSALILDLDPQNHSGPAMLEAFNDLDLIASYTTSFPDDLSQYKAVFVSLGIIFTGHELNSIESMALLQYLNAGGRLYLEGRRTWYDDPPQPIHHKFNIDVVVDTWFEYDTITGVSGTFTEGMIFDFGGSSPYNDYYMVPEESAFTILTSPEPDYGCVVAYDEGSYKTIGCAFEFGDLVDAENPSTKKWLMLEYLEFFGGIVTSLPDEPIENNASINKMYPNPFTDQTTVTFSLREEMHVGIDIFSMDGRKVVSLLEQNLEAGEHSIIWDGTDKQGNNVNSGIYLCTLKTNSVIVTKKLIRY
ncbi:MAG: T9SS type A sorting domain-containing protein, partial [Bacteroidales bacterium]|nr:T9SS type A sorting domain-containing protein [Bacteroidales bacterium]